MEVGKECKRKPVHKSTKTRQELQKLRNKKVKTAQKHRKASRSSKAEKRKQEIHAEASSSQDKQMKGVGVGKMGGKDEVR